MDIKNVLSNNLALINNTMFNNYLLQILSLNSTSKINIYKVNLF